MKNKDDLLSKATEALAQTPVPPGPPQETVDATIAKLTEAAGTVPTKTIAKRILLPDLLKMISSISKLAAAAVILITAGYFAGRLSAPKPPDVEQLQAAIEPVIRQNLLEEMGRYWQLSSAVSYARLKDQLGEQYRQDLNQFATRTLAASTTVTNELLEQLIDAINTAQTHDRRWVAAALQQIETSRLQDKTQLSSGLVTLATYTEDELLRARYDIAKFLADTQPNNAPPDTLEKENPFERKE
jgi:hypothetical protein